LRNQVRFVRTWSSPYMARLLRGRPLRIPVECVRTYAGKRQNFTISGCSFIGEYDILGLVQQIGIEGVGEIEIGG